MPNDDRPAVEEGLAPTAEAAPEGASEEAPEPAPLLQLVDGVPRVVETEDTLRDAIEALGSGAGPVAIDAERASGYRYSSRAYLIQLRREGSGTWLVDPIPFGSALPQLAEVLDGSEWVLHAATQDLPCLGEVGLRPSALFDTELAGRLLGYPRVGLATLVEEILGLRMRKEHSSADWSTRPLPGPWLEYAALDVEVLVELRDRLAAELEEQGKAEWARQEFEHLLGFTPTVRTEAWRRVSGLHRLKGRRALAVAEAVWSERDAIARQRDVTPGKIIPDAAIVALAANPPKDRRTLLATPGFHGRGAERYSSRWVAAVQRALEVPEKDLPTRSQRTEGPPHPRAWADRDPVADRRFKAAREATLALAEEHGLPVENLISPDHVRRSMWTPPATRDETQLRDELAQQLRGLGTRPWQVELVLEALVAATLDAERPTGTDAERPTGTAAERPTS